ncbi:MAG: hypothetical protein HYV18_01250 [Gammaproteobacteria bacterium]|nr:hypothetical protein [Gammaproteobacteria bacterium]
MAALLLSACLGGGDDDDTGALGTAEGVKSYAGTLLQMSGALEGMAAMNPAGAAPAAKSFHSLEADACDNVDGSVQRDSETKDVDSPFSESDFNVYYVQWNNCANSRTFEDESGSLAVDSTVDGRIEGGQPVDDDTVLYLRVGESSAAPLLLDVSLDGQSGDGSSSFSADVMYDVYARMDGTESNGDGRRELQYLLDLSGSANGSVDTPEEDGDYDLDFTAYAGRSGEPFVVTRDPVDGSQSFDGAYGFSVSPSPPGARCAEVDASIATLERLMPNTEGGSSPYSAGVLQLEKNGDRATIEFNDDNTVTITDSRGRSQTISFEEATESADRCAGFALDALEQAASG